MKRCASLFVVFLFCLSVCAQKEYFVYFQADKGQPFYVKSGGKIINAAFGYLILSQLRDSSYQLHIGFPGGKWPEQIFKVDIQAKDRGFLLKNFDDKAWGLIDLSSMTTLMASNTAGLSEKAGEPNNSAFNKELAKAANDPSLLVKRIPAEKPVIAEPQKKEEPAPVTASSETKQDTKTEVPDEVKTPPDASVDQPLVKTPQNDTVIAQPEATILPRDTVIAQTVINIPVKDTVLTSQQAVIVQNKPVAPLTEKEMDTLAVVADDQLQYARSRVIRISESSNTEGFGLIFLDQLPDGKIDTVRIMIPENRDISVAPVANSKVEIQKNTEQKEKTVVKEKCEKRAYILDVIACKRRLLSKQDEEQRLNDAKLEIRHLCYTTKQLKELSEVFPGDANKFRFFEAAVHHVFDPQNFADLSVALKDAAYKDRFKTLL